MAAALALWAGLVPAAAASAEEPPGSDLHALWRAPVHTLSAPARWDGGDLVVLAVLAGATVGAVLVEEEVRDYFVDHQTDIGGSIEDIGYVYGLPTFTVPVSLATWGLGALAGSPEVRETGLMMTEGMLVAGLAQQSLRIAVGRARPSTGEGNDSFDPFTLEDPYASFISGHAWGAFTLSTIAARQIRHPVADVALYTLAGTTAVSRVYADRHWLSDALLGSALGYFSGRTIWTWHRDRGRSGVRVALLPTPTGLTASVVF